MLDCFLNYSVNPNLRFHSRIDKIIDDVIREKINISQSVYVYCIYLDFRSRDNFGSSIIERLY